MTTFKETLNETRELLRKSNRQNLAHAYLRVEENIQKLQAEIVKQESILAEIEAHGDETSWIDQNSADQIRALYDRAHELRIK